LNTSSARGSSFRPTARDERGRAHGEHLRHREHDEREVAGDADVYDGFLAQVAYAEEVHRK
jgi:hypothetical protein